MSSRLVYALLVPMLLVFAHSALGDPQPTDSQKRKDRYGDSLPVGAVARLGTVRLRQPESDHIAVVAISPDGKIIASGGGMSEWQGSVGKKPYRIRLWDVATGKELRRFGGHTISIEGLAFSPDGKWLVSADDNNIRVWDPATGKRLKEIKGEARSVAFSPDGKQLAAATGFSEKETVRILDFATGKVIKTWKVELWTKSLAFSPDGKTLSGTVGGSARLWDAMTGRELLRFGGTNDADEVDSLVFAPDGKSLIAGWGNGTVRVWDVGRNRMSLELEKVGKCPVYSVAVSPNGRIIVAPGNKRGQVVLWDATTGMIVRRLAVVGTDVENLIFTPDGKTLVATGDDQSLILWDVVTGKERLPFDSHRGMVESLSFSPNGKTLASASRDGTVRLWDIAAKVIRQFCELDVKVWCVHHSPNGKFLASACGDGFVRLWDVDTGKEVRQWGVARKRPEDPFAVAFSANGKWLASADDACVVAWDVATGKESFRIAVEGGKPITGVAFSPDGKAIAVARDENSIELWSLANGKRTTRWVGGEEYGVSAVTFSPDGRTALASGEAGAIYVWEVATGKELPQFTRLRGGVLNNYFDGSATAFSPDGRLLATGTLSHPVDLREVLTGSRVAQFDARIGGHSDEVRALAFSPDGRTLATAGGMDHAILLWDVTGRSAQATKQPTATDVARLWNDLGSGNAVKANRALWALVEAGDEAVSRSRAELRPVPSADEKLLTNLIADLDNPDFEIREQADAKISRMGESAEEGLRRALQRDPPAETRRRIESLLERNTPLSSRNLTELRGVAVLEHVGTVKAREVLEALAKGATGARLTQEARAAIERMRKQKGTD